MIYEDRAVGLELWAVELRNCTGVTELAKVWSATLYYLQAGHSVLSAGSQYALFHSLCDPVLLHKLHCSHWNA